MGTKKPEDLVVCYLSGPEPNNDFQELINLGILPHNIWAFESDNQVYNLDSRKRDEVKLSTA